MQAIALYDTLEIALASEDSLTCNHPDIPLDERNFIIKARTLFREKTGFDHPLSIHVDKNIPAEGGFGGGSGNLATTLYAMNQLSKLSIDEETLRTWAGDLSSDAPFFFSSGTAFATGRGEKVASLPPLPSCALYLAKPKGKGLSTPLVYQHCTPNVHPTAPKILLRKNLWGMNDLEFPAFALRPDLKEVKKTLLDLGFQTVAMTGSGTGFFCIGDMEPPLMQGIQFWKTTFLSREEGQWYVV